MATLEELLASYKGQQSMASTLAAAAPAAGAYALSGGLGLVGAIAAPYITNAITSGMNRRSPAEEAALKSIRDVAEGGRTAAQTTLEYERGRTARMATQAASMGPARERTARQLVGQEQDIAAQQALAGRAAAVKMQEQAQAQRALADIETRAGESERQRQRQMMAGAVSGGLGALSQSYGGYLAGKQRQGDLEAQAAGAGEAVKTIESAMGTTSQSLAAAPAAPVVPIPVAAAPVSAAPAVPVAAPVSMQSINSMGIGQQPAADALIQNGRVMPRLAMPRLAPQLGFMTDFASGPAPIEAFPGQLPRSRSAKRAGSR